MACLLRDNFFHLSANIFFLFKRPTHIFYLNVILIFIFITIIMSKTTISTSVVKENGIFRCAFPSLVKSIMIIPFSA